MLCAQRKGKCNIFRGKTNLPVGVPADMPHGGSLILSFPSAEGRPLRRYSGAPLEARFTLKVSVHSGRLRRPGGAAVWRRRCRCPPAGARGGKGTIWFPCPLLTPPNPPFAATPVGRAAKRGLRGLGSVRFSAYMWLSCPEFSLRQPPRMTVRGQTVQGGSALLRKVLLRSMVYSWSTRRPCGPLAFRRATEGSRVQRKGWGVKRGRETLVSLPLLPLSVGTDTPGRRRRPMYTPCHGEHPPSREGLSRLRRQAAGTAERHTLC